MRLLLTIAIPTFDRADALERLLENLCAQPGIERVQVLVSDNGSTDRTAAVVDAYAARLVLKRTGFASNRGFDANYLNCVTTAEGDWLWVVGDDDSLVPSAVERVLGLLETRRPDLLVLNGGDFRENALVPRIAVPVVQFSTLDELLPQVGWHLCWIGTCVVRRDRYRPDELVPRDFNAFVHLPLLNGALRSRFSGVFVESVMLHTTVNHSDYFRDPRSLIDTFGSKLPATLACFGTDRRARATAAGIVRAFYDRLGMFGMRDFIAFRSDPRFGLPEFARRLRAVRRLNPWAPVYGLLYLLPPSALGRARAAYQHWRSRRRTVRRVA